MRFTLDARLADSHIFEMAKFKGESTGKYDATLIVPKSSAACRFIQDAIAKLVKSQSVDRDKLCVRDGDDTDIEAYQGCIFFKANTRKHPVLVDKNRNVVKQGVFYSGCMVRAVIDFWLLNSVKFPRRICCTLYGLQFVDDGDRIESPMVGYVAKPEDFDDLSAVAEFEDQQAGGVS